MLVMPARALVTPSAQAPTSILRAFTSGDGSRLPPVCLTYSQLAAAVAPLIESNKWAQDTLGDLWRMGSPMPPKFRSWTTTEEVRLLVPSAFMQWIKDVLERAGQPLDASAEMYANFVINGS